jgi:hypothetical protein
LGKEKRENGKNMGENTVFQVLNCEIIGKDCKWDFKTSAGLYMTF